MNLNALEMPMGYKDGQCNLVKNKTKPKMYTIYLDYYRGIVIVV